ncbi:wd40 repeat-like protein [Phaffia rhodozyma]|uniref:Wd40 repeat-like protein n=1 Tax=Phaffia rhodozyma TaxID=264483 RepID=A0A0F7SPD0_PHARH|nr:wd40 repeat-like protein [Phaffia rhodozyma]
MVSWSVIATTKDKGVSRSNTVETQHEEMIHDAQIDYYGKRLATCSSDKTIRVFDLVDGEAKGEPDILRGHTAPIWQLSWAHPSFGPILASASYDGKVFIWKEKGRAALGAPSTSASKASGKAAVAAAGGKGDRWEVIKEHGLHGASVNSVAWAPFELGPMLACASSDSKVSVITFNNDGSSDAFICSAHPMGATSVSWAPSIVPGSLNKPNATSVQAQQFGQDRQRRFVTGGCDSKVKIWGWRDESKEWTVEDVIDKHTDWVRDVAWAPNIGLPTAYIASCSQDRTVLIHSRSSPTSPWQTTSLLPPGETFPDALWRVSWSLAGNVLAVSGGDGKVSLWKEKGGGEAWECVSEMSA